MFDPIAMVVMGNLSIADRAGRGMAVGVSFSSFFGGLLERHDHALRRAGHFDAAPCRWPVRNGIRPAEGFKNADGVEMRRLFTSHIDERQKETKAFAASINGENQSDGHHSSKTGVFRQDFAGLEFFLEGPGCKHQCGNSGACADCVIYFDAWTLYTKTRKP